MSRDVKAKVPAIRFKGFSDEWSKEPLLQRVTRIVDFRGRTPKKLGMEWSEKGYLALSALNVKDGYIDYSADAHFGGEELYSKWMSGNELHKGQVLFTTEAPMGNVAQVPDDRKYILSQRTIAFSVDSLALSEDFLAVLLKSLSVQKQLEARSSGGTAKGVSQKFLDSCFVKLSDDLKEQQKIGDFFKQLDASLEHHKVKLDKLNNLKQAMLQKMFPQVDTAVPEIRFKGFEESWKTYEFKLIASRNTQRISAWHLPKVEYEDIDSGMGCLNKDVSKKESRKSGVAFNKGDVLFGNLRPYLKNWWLAEFEGIAIGDFWVLKSSAATSSFIYYLLQTKAFEKVANQSAGSKMPRSDWKLVSDSMFRIPMQTEEQQKIGSYFCKLDELIALKSAEVERLIRIKKSCFYDMFV